MRSSTIHFSLSLLFVFILPRAVFDFISVVLFLVGFLSLFLHNLRCEIIYIIIHVKTTAAAVSCMTAACIYRNHKAYKYHIRYYYLIRWININTKIHTANAYRRAHTRTLARIFKNGSNGRKKNNNVVYNTWKPLEYMYVHAQQQHTKRQLRQQQAIRYTLRLCMLLYVVWSYYVLSNAKRSGCTFTFLWFTFWFPLNEFVWKYWRVCVYMCAGLFVTMCIV